MNKILLFLAVLIMPASALAQMNQFDKLVNRIIGLASQAITFLMLLATIFFIWAVITLIRAKDEKTQTDAKKQLKNSVIGLAVMVTVWGLIKFAASTLGVSTDNSDIAIPCPPGTSMVLQEGRNVCK